MNRLSSASIKLTSALMLIMGAIALPGRSQPLETWRVCYQLGDNAQEIYAFATPSYYVNICQQGGTYYYIGTSRQNPETSLQLPARLIGRGAFLAENGNFNYSITDLQASDGIADQFELVVTQETADGGVDILRQEYSVPSYSGEDPSTMCDPTVQSC